MVIPSVYRYTRTQPLIQIKESVIITYFCRVHMFSATLLICSRAVSENQGYYLSSMSVLTREWVSPIRLIFHVLLTHYITHIDNRQFVGLLHKQNWAASTDMNLLSFVLP